MCPVGHLPLGQDSKPAGHGRSLASRGRIQMGTREGQEQGRRCPGVFPVCKTQGNSPSPSVCLESTCPTRAHSRMDLFSLLILPITSLRGQMGSFFRARRHVHPARWDDGRPGRLSSAPP